MQSRRRRAPGLRGFACLGFLLLASAAACSSSDSDGATTSTTTKPAPTGARVERGGGPEVTWLTVEPTDPLPGDWLTLAFDAESPDGSALSEGIRWTWNGRRLDGDGLEIQVPEDARRGDVIRVEVRVQKGRTLSEPAVGEVEVANTPESWVRLAIEPADEVLPGTELVAVTEVVDHDEDPIEFEYTWKVNGRVQPNRTDRFSTTDLRRGDVITLAVDASDGESLGTLREAGPVTIANRDPKIVSSPPNLSGDGTLTYAVEVKDPDGDRRFTYSLDRAPETMKIDPLTGVLTWTPGEPDVGKHPVEVRAEDHHGGFALQHFELTIGFAPPAKAADPEP